LADLEASLSLPAPEAARLLLGAVVRRGEVAVRLTEVEAYAGPADPGSHAYRLTPRSALMYGPPGRLYCYFVYGMHVCANVVIGAPGDAGAVLLRAGEVVGGRESARLSRDSATDRDLARGPARLCTALGITLADNGNDLTDGPVTLNLPAVPVPSELVRTGPRVGLRLAPDTPWRFWIEGEPSVSAYRPAVVRSRRGRAASGPSEAANRPQPRAADR